MKNLTLVEEFELSFLSRKVTEGKSELAVKEVNKGKNLTGIVGLSFAQLLLNGTFGTDKKDKLIVLKELQEEDKYLAEIYQKVQEDKPKKLKKWLDYYLYALTNKRAKNISNAVFDSMVQHDLITIVDSEARYFQVNDKIQQEVATDIKDSMTKLEMSEETLTLLAMLQQVKALKYYLSKEDIKTLKKQKKMMKEIEVVKLIRQLDEAVAVVVSY